MLLGWTLPSPPPSCLWTNTLVGPCSPASALPSFPALLPISYLYSDICFSYSQGIVRGRHGSTAFLFESLDCHLCGRGPLNGVSNVRQQLFYALLSFYLLISTCHLSINITRFCLKSSGRHRFRIAMFTFFLQLSRLFLSPFSCHIEFTSHSIGCKS